MRSGAESRCAGARRIHPKFPRRSGPYASPRLKTVGGRGGVVEGPLHPRSHGASERVLSDGLCPIVRRLFPLPVRKKQGREGGTPFFSLCPHPVNLVCMRCSFFEEAHRIGHKDFIPTESDVLRARTKTTGIYETRFSMGQLSIQLVGPSTLDEANLILS